jgi:hypothetical protein
MPKTQFELVNPCIIGQMNTSYSTESALDAATQFWNDLSPLLTNNVPKIYITLQNSKKDLFHFKISEKNNAQTKTADFSIREYNAEITSKQKTIFLKHIAQIKENKSSQVDAQLGGKKKKRYEEKDSSSDSSDSDSDNDDYYNFTRYKKMSQPIVYWSYTPTLYKVNTVYTPTFNIPLVPYINTWIPFNMIP